MDNNEQQKRGHRARVALHELREALGDLTYKVDPMLSDTEIRNMAEHQVQHHLTSIDRLIDVWLNTHPHAL
jgi:hypothetical protein